MRSVARVALLDTDTLSELSRGHAGVTARAHAYLREHGRLTLSAVTVFERVRGYQDAIRRGRPVDDALRQFRMLVGASVVIPFDASAAEIAGRLWAAAPARLRSALGDILIAGTALSRGLPLVTRNRRDFERIAGPELRLLDWTR